MRSPATGKGQFRADRPNANVQIALEFKPPSRYIGFAEIL
jgi:hypothetical protein